MGDMTKAEYMTELLQLMDNMPTDDPSVTNGSALRAINAAPNRLIRMYPDLFPEHSMTRSWTLGLTTVGSNRMPLPSNCLVAKEVRSSDSTVDPAGWEDTEERTVAHIKTTTIGLLGKDTPDRDDYPQMWDRKVNDIIYSPTTRTGFTTYLRLYGTSGEEPLVADGDTFRMHRDFDHVIVSMAGHIFASRLHGWRERSMELLDDVKTAMRDSFNVVAQHSINDTSLLDMPTREMVYGG